MVSQLSERQRRRVETKVHHVKSYLKTYYAFLEEYENVHGEEDSYIPLNGTWNPLQIMRNRRIRAQYGFQLKSMVSEWDQRSKEINSNIINLKSNDRIYDGIKDINFGDFDWQKVKLASRVFSKYAKARNIWQLNLYEILGDIYWRHDHWFELKDRDNELWFNEDGSLRRKVQIIPVLEGDIGNTSMQSGISLVKKEDTSSGNSKNVSLVGTSSSIGSEEDDDDDEEEEEEDDDDDDWHSKVGIAPSIGSEDQDDIAEFMNLIRTTQQNIIGKGMTLDVAKDKGNTNVGILTTKLQNQMKKFQELELQCQNKCRILNGKADEIESQLNKRNLMNEERENKIEALLGYCDRTSGDINTSITLQIRTLIERSSELDDGAESSFFVQTGSRLLERGVIALLWGVWLAVETWLVVKWAILGIWHIATWVLL